jgi:TnpA family transposase
LEDVPLEVSYVVERYFDPPFKGNINKPHRVTIKSQQALILSLYNYKNWSGTFIPQISDHLTALVKYHPKPEIANIELLKYFQQQKIIIPSYRVLQDIFTKVLSEHEARLNRILLSIPAGIKKQLNKIIGNEDFRKEEIVLLLNTIRYDQKNFKYTALKLEIHKVEKIALLYKFSKLFLPTLGISKNSISHYADLTSNYSTSRLKKLRKTQQYLHVLCFINYRYQQFMDNLIITFQYHVNKLLDKAKVYANDAFSNYSSSLVLDFPKLAEFLKWFPAEENKDLNFENFSQKAYQILPREQFLIMATFLEGKIFDKKKAQWEFYAKSSGLLARYLRPIMLHAEFVLINHKSNLLQLIEMLKSHYLNKKKPASLKITSNSNLIKEKSMIQYLKSTDNPDYLDSYRLEFYVYLKMYHHIKKGRLCCNDSISYKDLDCDLAPEEIIDQVQEIAKKFGYHKIPIYCDSRLDEALDELDKALIETNANIASGANKFINIVKNEDDSLSWDLIYEAKEPLPEVFFKDLPKIEIADLFKFVGDMINLWDGFSHIKHKYIKRKKPELLYINASVLAQAFGISMGHMAEMSDLNFNFLLSTKADFIRTETLITANDIASNYINTLSIFKAWDLLDGETLADADGKKHKSANTTLQNRFSKKYIGKGTGISIKSLVANHVVVNSKTIGLNDYEGHGLYDIVFGNKSDIEIDYVTGDNHSLNPINFVVLDSIDVGYLPSIKNIKESAKDIYSTRDPSYYDGLIKPKAQINKSLIKSNKTWITRVLLSLILQENTQTTLVRKLSSHERYARLNAALFEYNKIFKSIHVLSMINDINLRKAIKAARNRTESYHQLQGMIRKVYDGIFKGKRIVDNNVSAHAVRLSANIIIAYNSTILNILYEKLIEAKAPKPVIDNFLRISPVAWNHIAFTGRYNFIKDSSTIDLENVIKLLEGKLTTNYR